ncbi:MAG TPA: AAA family ATPase [Methylomusa anaerophila]|uniref:Regulatory protein RepA n=1 Tax=Methylomusa anaerophila TaxID=1930071 RepID=A0A348AIY4_9FIRM|nr:AAA family ATPase [Methylomusa anaerophila]BBB91032.1 regulatory protein RepA [Methylomusa anaerophila]HML88902.1 AAA family ATPase [Methylomusa anaerophila]
MDKIDLLPLLEYIDPANLSYQEWVNVGMALKLEGYTASDWDNWSRRDSARYRSGECFKKWTSFHGSNTPVTGGTIVDMAKAGGWEPSSRKEDYELDWDDTIGKDDKVIIDKNWLEGREVTEPETWDPVKDLVTYLETLFDSTENVGYVTSAWQKEGDNKYLPTKGNWDRTAGQLIEELNICDDDIGLVFGDYKPECGAWIRFNPLDGKGCKNDNVTDFRYSLVESDNMEIEKQNEIIRALELPVACLVHSGGKSLHAIVRIDAGSYEEYRKRVDYLYSICKKNGLEVDPQNRNPSRLSRMPGVIRNGHKQWLVDTNIGKANFTEWKEWIESVNDDLPEPESMADAWNNLPELAPSLIDGILRQGHKILIAGPSKAGKSFGLIELCCAIAEGQKWLSWACAQGKVLYVNLELDRASCLHRFKDVYQALKWEPKNVGNIDIWNLRGKSIPMDKLAPKLIRRAAKKNYIAIVIDPIYKVITGDENSADQMANFCNQFDKVCTELGCAVIYCHHHSKGAQGGKRSMDRASGSGVFARDPDALIDLIELDITEELYKQEENKAVSAACVAFLEANYPAWEDNVSQDDQCSEKTMLDYCNRVLLREAYIEMINHFVHPARQRVRQRTAWRIEGTLREFPKFKPVNLWFDYPAHYVDTIGVLKDVEADGDQPAWKRNFKKRKTPAEGKKTRGTSLESAFEAAGFNGQPTVKGMAEYMSVTEKTVKNHLKEHGGFLVDNQGAVFKKGK